MLLHLVADFGRTDLAFAEVIQRLKLVLPDAEVVTTTVPPFATLAVGFCVAQLALNPAPEGTVIFHNVAPRHDDRAARRDNGGERLAHALLPGGVRVVGVNAGYAFSFLRDAAAELRYVDVASGGSQFRSRDLFSAALARVLRAPGDALAEPLAPGDVPAVPERRLALVDGFGNLKTTLRADRLAGAGLRADERVRVTLAGVSREARVALGSFAVAAGELALSPGSSGWLEPAGGEVRWVELFLRGGSAWEAFGRPAVGEGFEISPGGEDARRRAAGLIS